MGVKNWKLAGNNLDSQIDAIQRKFALPRPIALFFASRGIEDVQDFLNPRLANLTDPYRFPKIKDAAKRLWEAIANKETILIHGDYDTDGITASALLALVLRQNGANVHSFIPHRFDDGYGFTPESLAKADPFAFVAVMEGPDVGAGSRLVVFPLARIERGAVKYSLVGKDFVVAGQQIFPSFGTVAAIGADEVVSGVVVAAVCAVHVGVDRQEVVVVARVPGISHSDGFHVGDA